MPSFPLHTHGSLCRFTYQRTRPVQTQEGPCYVSPSPAHPYRLLSSLIGTFGWCIS